MNTVISIVVPIYNTEIYLEECVESIINQSYRNLEIILIDDGSTDASSKICDYYADIDDRVKVVHKENGGLSDSRNVGISLSSGEYIAFIDSDDWIDKDMMLNMLAEMTNSGSDIVLCGYSREFKNTSFDVKPHEAHYSSKVALRKLVENVDIQDHACTSLYKKSLWDDIRFPVGVLYEDIRTIYKVFLNCNKIAVLSTPFYKYRQREGSITKTKFNNNKMESLVATNELLNVELIRNDEFCIDALNDRIIRVKSFILIDQLLHGMFEYDTQISECCELLRKNAFRILLNTKKRFPKSIRYLACLSLIGEKAVRHSFLKGLMNHYYTNKYQYYE